MAGSHRVQEYLERHKIGGLFEELMGKVIADQPDEPLVYLIRTLERKSARQGSVRKSTDTHGDKKRSEDKPWLANSKKVRPRSRSRSADRGKKSPSKPEWNHRTNTVDTFDELWESKELDGRKVSSGQRSRSPARKPQSWADYTAEDDHLFTSHGYRGPRHHGNEDPLDGEFSVSKETTVTSSHSTQSTRSVPKSRGQQHDSAKHKQQLEKLILSKGNQAKAGAFSEDSGIEDDRDVQTDSAIELMEDLEELQNEGATNIKASTGVSVRSSARKDSSTDSPVRVSICARCAKVMSGEPSISAPGVGNYGQLDDYDLDASRPQSAVRFSPDAGGEESDEEFESVSQVTGPRRPVWQDDSDEDSVTPRKGAHMFSASTLPAKGRPMYSPEHKSPDKGKKPTPGPIVPMARSADFQQHSANRGKANIFNQTWSPELETSSDEEVRPGSTAPSGVSGGGGGWRIHDIDDDASSYYVKLLRFGITTDESQSLA